MHACMWRSDNVQSSERTRAGGREGDATEVPASCDGHLIKQGLPASHAYSIDRPIRGRSQGDRPCARAYVTDAGGGVQQQRTSTSSPMDMRTRLSARSSPTVRHHVPRRHGRPVQDRLQSSDQTRDLFNLPSGGQVDTIRSELTRIDGVDLVVV
jgi:hypothetical protein